TDSLAMALPPEKALILCGGLQSSGTTLVSYCFLQRSDTDGVLDADNDLLPALDAQLARPFAWYKTTISSFRLSEIARHFRDAGWDVRTLLVLRDLRAVWASLRKKSYGRNGITAEDPPLRLRVRRFIEDWQSAPATGTVLLRYEDFVKMPVSSLQQVCAQLGLPWDSAMLTWPKAAERIADRKNGNGSFWKSRDANLLGTLAPYRDKPIQQALPAAELDWLESEFRDFNIVCGYPLHWNTAATDGLVGAAIHEPRFEVTRRYKWETAQKPFRWLLARLGRPNTTLIDRRSWKRAA
ncbi:MAG TPA: sulfotransferase, partial [Burkholderiales bacterium]|nr:sulfotransferase [Burkholderiales bacterium]